jgi:membrane protease subunit HflC
MKPSRIVLVIVLVLAGLLFFNAAYVIDETEQAVVTQFGRIIGSPKTEPGLYFRLPLIQNPTYFPKNLQEWDGDPGQIPTLDKTYLWVDTFARWRIVDPIKFYQTVNNLVSAKGRLDDIIDPAVRNFITSFSLLETVRNSNRELDTFEVGLEDIRKGESYQVHVGREKILRQVLEQAQPKLAQFGIELVDVKVKRVNYVEEVRESVYGRMIAERKQIAEKFRSEGKGEAQKILGEKERDLKRITSEAYRAAQEIMGKAEAESTRLFAESYGADPEFYSFVKTLETYADTLDERSTMVLSTDSSLMKLLKEGPASPAGR